MAALVPVDRFSTSSEAVEAQQLEDGRTRNRLHLKQTFEHIFDRYGKDYSAVTDDIDIRSGRIVVNNGHLTRMQNERDVGSIAWELAAQAASEQQTLALVASEHDEGQSEEQEEEEDDDDEDDNDDIAVECGTTTLGRPSARTHRAHLDVQVADRYLSDADDDADDDSDSSDASHDSSARGRRAVNLSKKGGANTVIVDEAYIAALAKRMADHYTQGLKDKAGGVENVWHLPFCVDEFPLPPISRLFGDPDQPHFRPRSPSPGRSVWAFPGQDSYFGHSRKRQRLNLSEPSDTVTAASAEEPCLDAAEKAQQDADASFRMLAYGINYPSRFTATHGDYTDSEDQSEDLSRHTRRVSASNRGPKRHFTADEDRKVKMLREFYGMSWKDIVKHMPGRTIRSIHSRYGRELKYLPRTNEPIIKREIIEIDSDEEATLNASNGAGQFPFDPQLAVPPRPPAMFNSPEPWISSAPPLQYTTQIIGTLRAMSSKARAATRRPRAPRYSRFDSTQGSGVFGILQASDRRTFPAQPPRAPSNAVQGSFGVCGVLRPMKKPSKPSKRHPMVRPREALEPIVIDEPLVRSRNEHRSAPVASLKEMPARAHSPCTAPIAPMQAHVIAAAPTPIACAPSRHIGSDQRAIGKVVDRSLHDVPRPGTKLQPHKRRRLQYSVASVDDDVYDELA